MIIYRIPSERKSQVFLTTTNAAEYEPSRPSKEPRAAMTLWKARQVPSRTLLSLIRGAVRGKDGSGLLILVLVAPALIGRLLKAT